MKNTKIISIAVFALFFPILVWAQTFQYKPLEMIPGSDAATSASNVDFYTYIGAIYKFGIWAIGIAALFMLIWGGYMYIASAGNNSSMEKAKGVITDALLGLLLAMSAYLILYIINPDLVNIGASEQAAGPPPPPPPPPPGSTLKCEASKNSASTDAALSCIRARLTAAQLGTVTTYGGSHVCNLSADPPKVSCHYGGRNCNGEANAIDFGGPAGAGGGKPYADIVAAANSCVVYVARCEDSAGVKKDCYNTSVDHVHITVKGTCGCT